MFAAINDEHRIANRAERGKKIALCPALFGTDTGTGAGTGAGVDMGTKGNVGTNSMALTFNEVSFDVACQLHSKRHVVDLHWLVDRPCSSRRFSSEKKFNDLQNDEGK